jgi:hypothetical protein
MNKKITKKDLAKVKAEIKLESKKRKLQKSDGLGPLEVEKIRKALRQVWHRSYARKIVVNRCTGEDGFPYCEQCKEMTPKLKIDHIAKVGLVDEGHISRLFCPSTGLQGLCDNCHKIKTKEERRK